MAPLPPEATGRVWIDYITGGGVTSQEHTVMVRYSVPLGGNETFAASDLGLFLTAPGPTAYFDGWKAIRARYSPPSNPLSFTMPLPAPLVAFVGTGQATATRQEQARETRFVGRDPELGRRAALSVYGLATSQFTAEDFRVDRIALNFVDEMLSVIDEGSGATFVSIGDVLATWYNYANWQFNSYWERRLRQ